MDAVDSGRDGLGDVNDRARLGGPSTCDAAWLTRATLAFVALGVLVRVIRYLLIYPLWCDETMLAANLLDRGYLDMLRPLDYRQVCPVLFLFVELTAVKLFGFSELSLRLFPFVCGVAGVFLFRHVAGRLLRGEALLFAVAIFAVSTAPIRYVGEVKPYASDLFVALVFLALAIEWWRRPERSGWLWGLAAFAPIGVGMSFPAILVAGGVSVGLLGLVWQSRRRSVWLAYSAYNLGVAATFLLLLRFYKTAPQDHAYFHHDWAPAFPPLDHVWSFVVWFLKMNTGFMFAYPEGGERGASAGTFACFLVAAMVLWRRGRWTVLALCLAPFGLALVAAALHRYPYGTSARTMQYVAPTICLMAGLGTAALLGRIRAWASRRNAIHAVVAVLLLFGFGRLTYDFLRPYRGASDELHRGFARWFWSEKARGAELVCPKVDFGLEFTPDHWKKGAVDTYLSYQKIHSLRHHLGDAPRLDQVSATHPLRFVFFNEFPQNTPAFQAWLGQMLRDFDLRAVDFYPVGPPPNSGRAEASVSYLVYEFIPKPGQSSARLVGISASGPVRR
jgi:Dolichyl-phosphate-mannose-protein mannosyltransferase